MQGRTRKHKSGNVYLRTPSGLWSRDPSRPAPAVDANRLTRPADRSLLLANQAANCALGLPTLGPGTPPRRKILIVGDGHGLADARPLLRGLPPDVTSSVSAGPWPGGTFRTAGR